MSFIMAVKLTHQNKKKSSLNFVSTINSYPKVCCWPEHDLDFAVLQKYHSEGLDVKALGFSSVTHLLHTVPCAAIEKPGGAGDMNVGDWLVYHKGTSAPKSMS